MLPGMKRFIYPTIDLNTDAPDRHQKPLSAGEHARLWFGSARTMSSPPASQPGSSASNARAYATSAHHGMQPSFDDDFVSEVDELNDSDDILSEVAIDWRSLQNALPELPECPEIQATPAVPELSSTSAWSDRRERQDKNWLSQYWGIVPFAAARLAPGVSVSHMCGVCGVTAVLTCQSCSKIGPTVS